MAAALGAIKNQQHIGKFHSENESECSFPHAKQKATFGTSRTLRDVLAASEAESEKAFRNHCVIDSWGFGLIVNILILLNAVEIGLSSELQDGEWTRVWRATGMFFAGSFTVEMLVKLSVLRRAYFYENWNLIDMFLVANALFEIVVLDFIFEDAGHMGSMTILRLLRLFKLLRLVRMLKVFKELIVLLDAMLHSLRTIFWVMLLLTLALYMFSIVCVEVIGKNESYPGYADESSDLDEIAKDFNNFQFFGTIARSMFSLFSLITLSEWSVITRPVAELQPYMVPPILVFGLLTTFGFMNVFVGIMVESALNAAKEFSQKQEADERKHQMSAIYQIGKILADLDTDGDGEIKLEEMASALDRSTHFKDVLTAVDLPKNLTVNELFLLMDDSGDSTVVLEEFESVMFRLVYCTEFQRMCLMQMSLNRVKHMLVQTMALIKGSESTSDTPTPLKGYLKKWGDEAPLSPVGATRPHRPSKNGRSTEDEEQPSKNKALAAARESKSPTSNPPYTAEELDYVSKASCLQIANKNLNSTSLEHEWDDSWKTTPEQPRSSTMDVAESSAWSWTCLWNVLRELREEMRIMKIDMQGRFDEMTNLVRDCSIEPLKHGESWEASVFDYRPSPAVQTHAPCDGGIKLVSPTYSPKYASRRNSTKRPDARHQVGLSV